MADLSGPRPHRYARSVVVGERFGRGVVIASEVRIPSKGRTYGARGARLRCDCGREYEATLGNLLAVNRAPTGSCGCINHRPRVRVEAGQRFGRGVVTDPDIRVTRDSGTVRGVRLRCDCGQEYETALSNLRSGSKPVRSCGCLHDDRARQNIKRAHALQRTHGRTEHPLYQTWSGMLSRCGNPNSRAYEDYGGRGIIVCARWHDAATFIADIELLLGPRPPGMTLNRIDNDGNYEAGNVEWADARRQLANRRSVRVLTRRLAAAVALLDEHGLTGEYRKRVT